VDLPYLGLQFFHISESLCSAATRVVADVGMLAGALALSREVLEDDPCQLASQIMGRLGQILAEDRPVAPGAILQQHPQHNLAG